MILSADVEPTEMNYQKVLAAAQKTAWQQFGQLSYEYQLVPHKDTNNPHVHIVINNYNRHTNRKLSLDKQDFLRIRSNFAEGLTKLKLKRHIVTLKRDCHGIFHKVNKDV